VHDPRQRVLPAVAGNVVLLLDQYRLQLLFRHAGDQIGLVAGIDAAPANIPCFRYVITARPCGVALVFMAIVSFSKNSSSVA
jgi:hypothetical protein